MPNNFNILWLHGIVVILRTKEGVPFPVATTTIPCFKTFFNIRESERSFQHTISSSLLNSISFPFLPSGCFLFKFTSFLPLCISNVKNMPGFLESLTVYKNLELFFHLSIQLPSHVRYIRSFKSHIAFSNIFCNNILLQQRRDRKRGRNTAVGALQLLF